MWQIETGVSVLALAADYRTKGGEENDDTRQMQRMLEGLGYYESTVDGKFGPKSVKALKKFQEFAGIEVIPFLPSLFWKYFVGIPFVSICFVLGG